MKYYKKVLQDYAQFSGRATRREFWYFFLYNFIIAFVLGVIGRLIGTSVVSIFYPAVLIPSIAVGVRRMHDIGRNGWYLFVPIYNIILAGKKGLKGENKYGSGPKAIT